MEDKLKQNSEYEHEEDTQANMNHDVQIQDTWKQQNLANLQKSLDMIKHVTNVLI